MTTPNQMNPWKVLGLRPGASPEIIRTAWRNGVLLYHPDTAEGSGDAEKFFLVNEAYRVLRSNPDHPEVTEAEDFLPSDRMPERVWRNCRSANIRESWDSLWDIPETPEASGSWWDDEPVHQPDDEPDDLLVDEPAVAPFPDIDYEPEPDSGDYDLDGSDLDGSDNGWDFDAMNLDLDSEDMPDAPFEQSELVDLEMWQNKDRKRSMSSLLRSRTKAADRVGAVGAVSVLPVESVSGITTKPGGYSTDVGIDGKTGGVLSGIGAKAKSVTAKMTEGFSSTDTANGPRVSGIDEARTHSVGADSDRPGGPVMHPAFVPGGVALIVGIRLAVQTFIPPAANLSVLVIVLLAVVATVAVRIFVSRKLVPDTVAAAGFPVLAVFIAAGDALALILVPLVAVGSVLVVRARRQVVSQ